jgi:hypothetical protein
MADMANLAAGDSRFAIAKANPQAMLADLAQLQDLQTVLSAAEMATQMLKDTQSSVIADAWQQAMAIYALAQTLAKSDPVLRLRISGIATFLQRKTQAKGKKSTAPGEEVSGTPEASAPSGTTPVTVTTTTSQPANAPVPTIVGTRQPRRADKKAHVS